MNLYFLNGARTGESFPLTPPFVTIGRETDNMISVPSGGLSRYHAKLEWDAVRQSWSVTDLLSTNGTKINGIAVGNIPTLLKANDVLSMGDQLFKLTDAPAVMPSVQTPIVPAPVAPAPLTPIAPEPIIIAPQPAVAPAPSPAPIVPPPVMPDTTVQMVQPAHLGINAAPGAVPPATPPVTPGIPGGDPLFSQTAPLSTPEIQPQAFSASHIKELNIFEKAETPDAADNNSPEAKRRKKIQNLIMFTCVLLAVIFIAGVIAVYLKSKQENEEAVIETPRAKPLRPAIIFERQIATKDNVFQFFFHMEQNLAYARLYDAKHNIRFQTEKVKLRPDTIEERDQAPEKWAANRAIVEQFEQGIRESKAEKLKPGQLNNVKSPSFVRFTIVSDEGTTALTDFGDAPPYEIEKLANAIYLFSGDMLALPGKPFDELIADAENHFNIAEDLKQNLEANEGNIQKAIYHYKCVVKALGIFNNPRPQHYLESERAIAALLTYRDDLYNRMKESSESAFQLGDYQKSLQLRMKMISLLNEIDDAARYRAIQDDIDKIRKRINRK